jgi:hypothetical protein
LVSNFLRFQFQTPWEGWRSSWGAGDVRQQRDRAGQQRVCAWYLSRCAVDASAPFELMAKCRRHAGAKRTRYAVAVGPGLSGRWAIGNDCGSEEYHALRSGKCLGQELCQSCGLWGGRMHLVLRLRALRTAFVAQRVQEPQLVRLLMLPMRLAIRTVPRHANRKCFRLVPPATH